MVERRFFGRRRRPRGKRLRFNSSGFVVWRRLGRFSGSGDGLQKRLGPRKAKNRLSLGE